MEFSWMIIACYWLLECVDSILLGYRPNSYLCKSMMGKLYEISDPRSKHEAPRDSKMSFPGQSSMSHNMPHGQSASGSSGQSADSHSEPIIPVQYRRISSRSGGRNLQAFNYSAYNVWVILLSILLIKLIRIVYCYYLIIANTFCWSWKHLNTFMDKSYFTTAILFPRDQRCCITITDIIFSSIKIKYRTMWIRICI